MNDPAADLVIFDLDGTLLDSHRDIYRCVVMALHDLGVPDATYKQVAAHGGIPLHMFHEAFGLPVPYERFLTHYRALQDVHGLDTTRPYDGVPELLASLAPVPLAVASTKPTVRVVQHTTALGIDRFFAHLQGTDQPPYKPDPAILYLVLERFDVDPARCWMVGDQVTDIQAGSAAGMRTLGVTWSDAGEGELREAGADQVAHNVGQMGDLLGR